MVVFKRIFVLVILLILFLPLRTILYLGCEFILCINRYDTRTISNARTDIPKRIHQVFFKVSNFSQKEMFAKGPQSCIKQNPSYKYTLWNETIVDMFVQKEYPNMKDLYNSYDHWVKRLDVTKYLVLYHFGGWYIDMDILCKRSIDNLLAEAKRKDASVIVHTTGPFGFSTDFLGISVNHPFLNDVISSLRHSNQQWFFMPYASTMFSTGPTFFWGRYLNYPQKEDFYIISNHSYYIDNLHGSSWHSLDGVMIWFIFRNLTGHKLYLLGMILTFTFTLVIFRYKRRLSSHEFLNQ